MPAQATAKSVIASAKRLMEVRHCCRNNSKIAEISVPAWPIPIHHTKLTIAKPQPMGILMPQMPTPLISRYASVTFRSISRQNEMAKPKIQPLDVPRPSTIELILSVTVSKRMPRLNDRMSRS